MATNITTTIVAQFTQSGGTGILTAEFDGREDGFNGGRTSFAAGDQPAFLIFMGSGVSIVSITPSAGSIGDLGIGTIEVEEVLTFADADEATLQKPIYGSFVSYKWLGNNLGVPTVVQDTKVRVPTKGVGVLKVSYLSQFIAKQISGLGTTLNGESDYSVLVLILGQKG